MGAGAWGYIFGAFLASFLFAAVSLIVSRLVYKKIDTSSYIVAGVIGGLPTFFSLQAQAPIDLTLAGYFLCLITLLIRYLIGNRSQHSKKSS